MALAIVAAIVLVSPPAGATLDSPTAAAYGGSYSPDCRNPAAPHLSVGGNMLTLDAGGRRVSGYNPVAKLFYPAPTPPPGFQATLIGRLADGERMLFVVFRDAAGLYVSVTGDSNLRAWLGQMSSWRFRTCDPPRVAVIPAAQPEVQRSNTTRASQPGATNQPCDLRHVDWRNFNYPGGVHLSNGTYSTGDADSQTSVSLDRVQYGKLRGEGDEQALVTLSSDEGSAGTESATVYVFEIEPTCSVHPIGRIDGGSSVKSSEVVGHTYVVVSAFFKPGDPMSTPSGKKRTVWRLVDGTLKATVAGRSGH